MIIVSDRRGLLDQDRSNSSEVWGDYNGDRRLLGSDMNKIIIGVMR